jgi:hypothetical protein
MRIGQPVAERSRSVLWGRRMRRWSAACLLGCATSFVLPALAPLWASPPTSSRVAKEEAVAEIPFDKLTRETRAKLLGVLEKPSIYRRLPEKTIQSDPDMYLFLVRNPEVVVNIWELMGVTNVKLQRIGEYKFECSDGAGTDGTVELVYGTHDLHVLYAEATYEGPLTGRKLNGRGVMVLKSTYKTDANGNAQVESRLDVFIQIEQLGADLVARTLQPLVGKAADVNFEESANFVGRVSEAAENNGPGMQRLAAKLVRIPAETRTQFAEVSAVVSERAELKRQLAQRPPALDPTRPAAAAQPPRPKPPGVQMRR